MKNPLSTLSDLKKLASQAEELKKQLANITITAKNAESGEVEILINGNSEVQSVKIDLEKFNGDAEKLNQAMKAAINNAIQQAQFAAAGQAQGLMGQ